MKTNRRMFIKTTAGSLALTAIASNIFAKPMDDKNQMIRVARLKIDPAQLDNYKVLLKEEIETSVKAEPGVLTLYSVAEKDNPTNITVFEIYADEAAYRSHIETPHFKKYKNGTKDMVKSIELIDMVPIALASKK